MAHGVVILVNGDDDTTLLLMRLYEEFVSCYGFDEYVMCVCTGRLLCTLVRRMNWNTPELFRKSSVNYLLFN
jgi:hypothetical protein